MTAILDFDALTPQVLTWCRPSCIPWADVDVAWQATSPPPLSDSVDSDDLFAQWASNFEAALDGHVSSQPQGLLTGHQRGRSQTHTPTLRDAAWRALKPSRNGEVNMRGCLAGHAVRSWFRQLRRLQSYRYAAASQRKIDSVEIHKLELWSAIRRASGFVPTFVDWWALYGYQGDNDAPWVLPLAPPDADVADTIFRAFKVCYDRFESWHLRQRRTLLRAKHDRTLRTLHRELKEPAPSQLDLLWEERQYEILAVDVETSQLQLDRDLCLTGTSQWWVNETPVTVLSEGTNVCTVIPFHLEMVDSVLFQKCSFSTTAELHDQLVQFWEPKWKAFTDVPLDTWSRAVSFFKAFVPTMTLTVPDLTLDVWRAALRRYGPRSARGVDGWSPQDLIQLPDEWTLQLISLLTRIQQGSLTWPRSILFGTVFSLAKKACAHLPSHYRPVVIFSAIYRTWSGIHARALLSQLEPMMQFEAFGFLPTREAAQHWLVLQGRIELALVSDSPLCGLTTDLCKAFEHIPRQLIFALADHIGIPTMVTTPWKSFLNSCLRSFEIRGCLSPATSSTVGMPEGDGLSVLAMAMLDLTWHCYLHHFCPTVVGTSFVDNLSIRSSDPVALLHSLTVTITFFQLWNLSIDEAKTFTWGTTSGMRKLLQAAPYPCVDTAAELGGSLSLSFTARHRNCWMRERLTSLAPRWRRLLRSSAPLAQKLAVLPGTFWAKALHGAPACRFATKFISDLRAQACKALRLAKAGANSVLRLSLSGNMRADPGFFQLVYVISTFRRICAKMAPLVTDWHAFMALFVGQLGQGPFSKFLEMIHGIGWRLEIPYVFDHDGLRFHVLDIDQPALMTLLEEAWLLHIPTLVCHRATMVDLRSLDRSILNDSRQRRSPLQLALQSSLQSGAYIDRASHAKYDVSKVAQCSCCGIKDDQAHWLICPRYQSLRVQAMLDDQTIRQAPEPLKLHLLPERNPHVSWFKSYFETRPSQWEFLQGPVDSTQVTHVFTDGSCVGLPFGVSYASWSVVSMTMTSSSTLAAGHLAGFQQSINRAELTAVIVAVSWSAHFRTAIHLWVDSKFVADGFQTLGRTFQVPTHWHHRDLWHQLLDLLHQCEHMPLCTWIPSHLDRSLCTGPDEDWVAEGNDLADSIAVSMNQQRANGFWQQCSLALAYHDQTLTQLCQLRAFYEKVAAHTLTETSSPAQPIEPENSESLVEFLFPPKPCLSSCLPSWQRHLVQAQIKPDIPAPFVNHVLDWLLCLEEGAEGTYVCSWYEMVFGLISHGTAFPHRCPRTGHWHLLSIQYMPARPTLANLVYFVRLAVRVLVDHFDLGDLLIRNVSKLAMNIIFPVEALALSMSSERADAMRKDVQQFTASWPLRRSVRLDLARLKILPALRPSRAQGLKSPEYIS